MVEWAGEPIITTDRLVLRTFRTDDLPAYAALNAHAEVMRRLGLQFDHEAEIVDDGLTFSVVVHSITAARWSRRPAEPESA